MRGRESSEQHVLEAKRHCLYFDVVFSVFKLSVISRQLQIDKTGTCTSEMYPASRVSFNLPRKIGKRK